MNTTEGRAQQDNQAFEEWMAVFWPWVRSLAHQWRDVPGLEPADVEQAAWLGLAEALRTYCAIQGAFEPWARGVMRRRMVDAIKGAQRVKHQPLAQAEALVDANGREKYSTVMPDPLDQLVDHDRLRWFMQVLVQALSPLELRVLRVMIRGGTLRDSAAWAGISPKMFDNTRQRVRRKARTLWDVTIEREQEAI